MFSRVNYGGRPPEERAQVPKFGNWESEEEVPYTMYFDNARKGKKSGQIYQTDSQDNTEKSSESKTRNHERHSSREEEESEAIKGTHKRQNPGSEDKSERRVPEALRKRHERGPSREEGEMRRAIMDSPMRNSSSNSPRHRLGGETPKRVAARQGVGPDQSPHHPNSRVGGKNNNNGISSPSWERKGASEGSSHHGLAPLTPGRSRLRSVTRGDDSPDRSPAVPKFGDWDETDPASAEGYTQVFNRVREEKHSETGKVPIMPTETSYSNSQKQCRNDNSKGCSCFPWSKR
ncbi:hypothetical protein ACP275_07G069700 [Erythranthe tilingii]